LKIVVLALPVENSLREMKNLLLDIVLIFAVGVFLVSTNICLSKGDKIASIYSNRMTCAVSDALVSRCLMIDNYDRLVYELS